MRLRVPGFWVVPFALLFVSPREAMAQSAENVAVVINDNSPDSRRIGEYYAKTRGLPDTNVLRVRTSLEETIDGASYLRTIDQPLRQAINRAGLQDRILYLVLTKGVPLRIQGSSGANGSVASVDSELTLLYRRMVGQPIPANGKIDNPYVLGDRPHSDARPFSHREHDIYLVTRIDAYTVDQAIALIDRAQAPGREGRIVLDQRGAGGIGNRWMERAGSRLVEQGHGSRVMLETTAQPARGEKDVLGYYSWGAADPENRVRSVEMTFVPGAIAANLASFDARTFQQPPDAWRPSASADKTAWFEGSPDTLVGDLIRGGITGVSGQVDEAFAAGGVRPDILFPAYLAGFNLVEAFYLATPALSWQTVIIGDPLCSPFGRKPLTREELEEERDISTGYPGIFGRRRTAVVRPANRDVPDTSVGPLMRTQAMLDAGNQPGARLALTDLVAAAPQAPGPLLTLAGLEEEAGDYDAAIQRYRRILEIQPNRLEALNNLAYALAVRRNAPAEALPFAQRAAAAAPSNGRVLDTIAWIHHLLGNHDIAAKLLEQAVRREPGDAQIRVHAALVYQAAGQFARARIELDEAARLDSSVESQEEVRRLRIQLASTAPSQ